MIPDSSFNPFFQITPFYPQSPNVYYEHFNADPESNKSLEELFADLKSDFSHLFTGTMIQEVQLNLFRTELPNVGLNHLLVATYGEHANPLTSEYPGLGTTHITSGIVVCASGQDQENKTSLALFHSYLENQDPEFILESITQELLARGCSDETLAFYLIGGTLNENKFREEETYLNLSHKYPIQEVCFNLVAPTEQRGKISLIFTPTKIIFSSFPNLFSSIEGLENAGVFFAPKQNDRQLYCTCEYTQTAQVIAGPNPFDNPFLQITEHLNQNEFVRAETGFVIPLRDKHNLRITQYFLPQNPEQILAPNPFYHPVLQIGEDPHQQDIDIEPTLTSDEGSEREITLEDYLQYLHEKLFVLKSRYNHLFNCGFMQETWQTYTDQIPDVDQDKLLIVSSSEYPAIGTRGLGPCIAVCARGQDANGISFLALYHNSIEKPHFVLEAMTTQLEAKGCLRETHAFYLIGGVLDEDGLETQKKFLKLSDQYPIKEVCFNLVAPDDEELMPPDSEDEENLESISVILTPSTIFFSRSSDLFSPIKGLERAGVYLE